MIDIAGVKKAITGPFPSIRTPFLKNGDIDFDGLRNMVDFSIEEGKSKTLLLTYGDSLLSMLTDQEVLDVTKAVVEQAKGRAMVTACGKPWTNKQNMEFLQFAKDIGADLGIPVLPDWAQSMGADECYDFTCEVGKIMPIMLLSNTMRGRGIPLSVFEKLKKEKPAGFVGVKDDVCGEYGKRLAAILDNEFAFMSGGLAINFLEVAPFGADGYLSLFMSFMPELALDFWQKYSNNDYNACGRWIADIEIPFLDMVSKNGLNFDAVSHGMMELCGVCQRYRRAPYMSLSDEQMEILKAFKAKL